MPLHLLRAGAALLIAAAFCAGCGVTRAREDGTYERVRRAQLRDYAMEVFRRHNAVTTTLMHRMPGLEAVDPDCCAALEEGEAAMLAACEPLDALAIRHRDGERVGVLARLRLPRAIVACEDATRRLEQVLDDRAAGSPQR